MSANPASPAAAAPIRAVPLGARDVRVARRADGTLLLAHPQALGEYPARFTDRFLHWAAVAPDRTWIAERDAHGAWRRVSYGEAAARMRAIGAGLLDRGLSAERPLAILSGNDVEHALLALACSHVGIPFAPISTAYSLVSSDHGKLKFVLGRLTPGLVFAADGAQYERAIRSAVSVGTEVVVTERPIEGYRCTRFEALAGARESAAVARAHAAIDPDAPAKFLFTSGSTGTPKAVIVTERMLCSNLEMAQRSLPVLAAEPPVIVDWLPWNHVFGGNHNFGAVVWGGGTHYIDAGRPVPGAFEQTVANLREIAPTIYYNVPRGFELLAERLARDAALCETFFSRVKMLFYAGAGISQPVWDAYDALAVRTIGRRIMWTTSLGATETAPAVTFTTWEDIRAGHIGLPAPGVEVKLAPVDDKWELRVRGPSITPGYWREPELTRAAFDEEGFYRLGDGVKWVDPDDPTRGLAFDGRIAEDFKLSSGTWVNVGVLRAGVIAAGAPYVQDVVIAGLNRDALAALVFPNVAACRALCPDLPADAPIAAVLGDARVRASFESMFERLRGAASGSATRIERVALLSAPPSLDAGEITDKGSINQRAVLTHRAAIVEHLYTGVRYEFLLC